MERFRSFDGVELAFCDSHGSGESLVMLHDFTTSSRIDWVDTGVYSAFVNRGMRAVLLDARGHGESEKPHASYYYWNRAMAKDVHALSEYLGLEEYGLMGYAMGAKVAIEAALMYEGVKKLTLVGISVYDDDWHYNEAERLARVKNMLSRRVRTGDPYRRSAEPYSGDRKAFAARLQGAILPEFTRSELRRIRIPVLVVNGNEEEYSAPEAACCFPSGEGVTLGGDHRSVLMNSDLPARALRFLERAGAE
jgi:pimeloyl-ACP methyl ester carboxylesterase